MSVISPIPRTDAPPLAGNLFERVWYQFLQQVYNICFAQQQSGSTANRPVKNLWIGRRYFDTDLGEPVWLQSVNPDVWIGLSGNAPGGAAGGDLTGNYPNPQTLQPVQHNDTDDMSERILDFNDTATIAWTLVDDPSHTRIIIRAEATSSGGAEIKQTEVDAGTLPVNEATFTVTDSDIDADSKIQAWVAMQVPTTGRPLDELKYDRTTVQAIPAAGSMDLLLQAFEGQVVDAFVINYMVG